MSAPSLMSSTTASVLPCLAAIIRTDSPYYMRKILCEATDSYTTSTHINIIIQDHIRSCFYYLYYTVHIVMIRARGGTSGSQNGIERESPVLTACAHPIIPGLPYNFWYTFRIMDRPCHHVSLPFTRALLLVK